MAKFRTLEQAIEFSQLASQIKIQGHLKDQLNRASTSIALNLSEGNAKGLAKEKSNFFHMAFGSLRECQTIFKLIGVENGPVVQKADLLGASLNKLVNSDLKDSPNWRKGHR